MINYHKAKSAIRESGYKCPEMIEIWN